MSVEGNADSKLGEKKMEGEEDSVIRTVDCLRGRLLAERVASRNAKEEADQLENKLIGLENLLKEEAKSRNRAEKKLRSLMKKLQSVNISYVSDEYSEYSAMGKSDISSVSSTTSSSITKSLFNLSDETSTTEERSSSASETHLPKTKAHECRIEPNEDSEQNVAQNATVNDSNSSSAEKSSHQDYNESKINEHSAISSSEEGLNQEDYGDHESQIDNSMALVPVDVPQETHTVDPEVLDATVKEVLDALRYAKEQLQSSMERKRTNMIRVG